MRRIGRMRRIRLIGLIGLMGLMGCSNDRLEQAPEPVPVVETGKAISFNGQQGEEQVTRAATPLNEAGVTAFTVYGYKNDSYTDGEGFSGLQTVFPGYCVNWTASSAGTTTSNSDGWEYVNQQTGSAPEQTIKYWDWGTKAYRFFAVTAGAGAPSEGIDGSTSFTMAVDCSGANDEAVATKVAAAPYFSKLWFSTGMLPAYADKQFGRPVQLMFQKPFTRVRMIIKYTYPREGINLTGLQFKPTDGTKIARKGTVTVIYPLTGTDTKETYSSTRNADPAEGEELTAFTVDYDPEDDSKEYEFPVKDGWYTVFPNMSQGSYTLNVNVNGSGRTAAVPAQYMRWLPGYSYTYVFKINEEGGVEIGWVEYAVTPWTEMEINHTTHNW